MSGRTGGMAAEGRGGTMDYTDEQICSALLRYIDRYHWSWNMAMRLINMYYGTQYTEKQLRALYREKRRNGDAGRAD